MNQKERMDAGLPYKAWLDGLKEKRMETRLKIYDYNQMKPSKTKEMKELILDILGSVGDQSNIKQPFQCDYGSNIFIGDNFFSNYNCIILDVGKVIIGDNVMFGPNVAIYTAGHPIHPESRNSGYEYGIPVTIGDNVWLGGNVVVLPGVSIGNNVVIGTGSVVTKSMPDDCLAVGNPCKVIKEITQEDRKYYYKDREFDVDDY